MSLDQTRAYLEGLERSAAKLALPPACPKCNSKRTTYYYSPRCPDETLYHCAKCGHRFAQLALFPLPVASPATLTLTPTDGPAPRQASLFSPQTSGQEE